jgi:pSer/pThr/pTyr-binding forkhead associated (FHA) protein
MNLAPSDEQNSVGAEETIVRPREQAPSGMKVDRLMTQRAYLEVTAGTTPGQRFYLAQRDQLIGRSTEVDIPLSDDSISRFHAKVIFRNDEFILVDLGSKNGTFLNGTNVHECPLRAGDEIMIGNHSLQFLFEAVRASSL